MLFPRGKIIVEAAAPEAKAAGNREVVLTHRLRAPEFAPLYSLAFFGGLARADLKLLHAPARRIV